MAASKKGYAIIHLSNGKQIKKSGYESCSKAFYDYEHKGAVWAEVYNERNQRLASTKKPEMAQ